MDVYERRVGIHGFTNEQKLDACRKGGLVRGPLSYQLRIGCHALPPEVVREQLRSIASLGGKVGGVASVLAQGMVPYVPVAPGRLAELEFASSLAAEPRYRGPVRANFGKIADKVNEMFHAGIPHYTRITMKVALQRHRRRERSGAVCPSDPEMSFTERLTRDPAYQFLARLKAEEIAREVNAQYHGGQPVRNSVSIRAAIRRHLRHTRTFPGASKPNGQPHVDRPALASEWPDLAHPPARHVIVEVNAAQRERVIPVQ
jgi:hypothetical protein